MQVDCSIPRDAELLKAIVHAERAKAAQLQDFEVENSQASHNILIEYAKLDDFDLILVLRIEDSDSKWCLISEEWLKNQVGENG